MMTRERRKAEKERQAKEMEEERGRTGRAAGEDAAYANCDQGGKTWRLLGCTAAGAETEERDLSFFFPDGIWLPADHRKNPAGCAVRTGPAKACYRLADPEGAVYVYKEEKDGRTVRRIRPLPWLEEKLNDGKARLEFGREYRCGTRRIVEGLLRREKEKDARAVELRLDAEKLYYFWNGLPQEEALPASDADGAAQQTQEAPEAEPQEAAVPETGPAAAAFPLDEDDDAEA